MRKPKAPKMKSGLATWKSYEKRVEAYNKWRGEKEKVKKEKDRIREKARKF